MTSLILMAIILTATPVICVPVIKIKRLAQDIIY